MALCGEKMPTQELTCNKESGHIGPHRVMWETCKGRIVYCGIAFQCSLATGHMSNHMCVEEGGIVVAWERDNYLSST